MRLEKNWGRFYGSLRSLISAAAASLLDFIHYHFCRFKRFASLLFAGGEEFRAESTLWFVRPLMRLLLLGALLALGLKELYVDNPSFGATPLTDYFSLALWGLGANVASRTLANLKDITDRKEQPMRTSSEIKRQTVERLSRACEKAGGPRAPAGGAVEGGPVLPGEEALDVEAAPGGGRAGVSAGAGGAAGNGKAKAELPVE